MMVMGKRNKIIHRCPKCGRKIKVPNKFYYPISVLFKKKEDWKPSTVEIHCKSCGKIMDSI